MHIICLSQNLLEKPSQDVAEKFAADMIHFKAVPVSNYVNVHIIYMYMYVSTDSVYLLPINIFIGAECSYSTDEGRH